MKPLSHHINKVKAQPHHIRKHIAFVSAFIVAAIIGVIWAGASLATGAFALHQSNFAEATGAETANATVTNEPSATSLAASPAEANAATEAPGIEIVNADAGSQTPAPASQPTVIPF